MLETALSWLTGLEAVQSVWRITGMPKVASWWLRRRGGVVNVAGFQFFPDRPSLQKVHGTLGHRLNGVSSVSAILVVGTKFYRAQENLGIIKQLLLPNPDSEALKWFATTIDGKDTPRVIKETTRIAQSAGAKVRWYDHFNFHSIILADVDRPSGWVHVEMVLPYSRPEKRPSYTVQKRQSEETVREIHRVFQEIWDAAKDAPSTQR